MAAVSGGQRVIYGLFHWLPFLKAFELMPSFFRSVSDLPNVATWFEFQVQVKGIYNSALGVMLIFMATVGVLVFTLGFYLALLGAILGYYNPDGLRLLLWLFLLVSMNVFTAAIQATMFVYFTFRGESSDLAKVLRNNLSAVGDAFGKYFLRSWYMTPYISTIMLVLLGLMILIHWPIWLWNSTFGRSKQSDLRERQTMLTYYIRLTWVTGVFGAVMLFANAV